MRQRLGVVPLVIKSRFGGFFKGKKPRIVVAREAKIMRMAVEAVNEWTRLLVGERPDWAGGFGTIFEKSSRRLQLASWGELKTGVEFARASKWDIH